MKNNLNKIILIVVVIYGSLLRSVELFNRNYLFGIDQGRDYLAVSNIVDNHKLTLIGSEVGAGFAGINGLFHGPFYYYLLTIPYVLFRGDPYGSLILMFILGVGTLILGYIFLKKIFDKRTALLTVFLLAICPALEGQSRFLWNTHPATVFIIIVLYLVFLIDKNPIKYFPLALFTAGFIYNFQTAIAVPIIIAIIFYGIAIIKIRNLQAYLFGAVALVLAFSPLILFQFRHDFLAFRGIINYLLTNNNSQIINYSFLLSHINNYWDNFTNTFVYFFPLLNFKYMQYFLFGAVFLLGIFVIWQSKDIRRKNYLLFIYILLFVTWGFFLLLQNIIWDYYLIHLHIVYIILFAVSFFSMYDIYAKNRGNLLFILLCIFLSIFTIESLNRLRILYTVDLFDYGSGYKIKGKLDAIDYVYHDAKNIHFNLLVFMSTVYTYPYDYLLKWYGNKIYGYIPGKENKGLLYLIMEIDQDKPWLHQGWLETVIVKGEILDTKVLPSGLIVQKRLVK